MSITFPAFEPYGNYRSANYGVNALKFTLGPLTVWFSYKTPVAFRVAGGPLIVSENCWGPTTGKHLNWIDNGDWDSRLARPDFKRALSKAIDELFGHRVCCPVCSRTTLCSNCKKEQSYAPAPNNHRS